MSEGMVSQSLQLEAWSGSVLGTAYLGTRGAKTA